MISLITSTLNCAQDLELTVQSVREQRGAEVDWIIADGASTDETLTVIQRNAELVSHWFSEKDSGIYDAWNKAIQFARGEWILFFGAGDTFCDANTLARLEEILHKMPDDIGLIYGNVIQRLNDKQAYFYGQVDLEAWEDYRPSLPAHQGTLVRRRFFIGKEPFDSTYRIVADSKFLLSTLRKCSAEHVNINICNMLPGGVSSSPCFTLYVAKEFMRLENDLGYKLPYLKKIKYLGLSYIKYGLWKLLGNDYYFEVHRWWTRAKVIK